MTSDPDARERMALRLVEDALALEPGERRDFVLSRTTDDPLLRRRVLSIMEAEHGRAPGLETGGALNHAPDAATPESIGAYRIEREIGRGGMGVVYLGRRITDDFDHAAAIKVVRAGAASPRLIERLRAERRMLAGLKHPNIAQMYDGGETDEGTPYFVMEFVQGSSLDEYLATRDVPLDGRLKLFLDACAAVSFAHRNLVIHRDLTPANMLVSDDGDVKLIDFGISHSLDEAAPATQPRTTMTKGYAAPERIGGSAASTVADVYSLGIILHEATEGLGVPRGADLAAIVAKASAPTPDDRYQTVDALISDLEAYRRGDAVSAVGGGWRYALRRFVGRRRLAVGAGALALVSVLAASVIMSVLYIRAEAAERRTAERFNEVREMAGFIMFDFHDEVAKLEGSTSAREMLAKTALDYLDALSATPGASDDLKLEVARGYKRLSDVTGNLTTANLGRRAEAYDLLTKATTEITELRLRAPDSPDVLRVFVNIAEAQALVVGLSNNDYERGVALIREAQTVSASLMERVEPVFADRLADARLHTAHGYLLQSLNRGEAAMAQLKTGIAKFETLAAAYPDDANIQLGLARANVRLGEAMAWHIYFTEGDYEETLPYFDKGVELKRELARRVDATSAMKTGLISGLFSRANTTCYIEGRENEGLADLEEAEAVSDALLADDPNDMKLVEEQVNIISQRFDCYRNLGRFAEAERASVDALALLEHRAAITPDNPEILRRTANLLWLIAMNRIDAGEWEMACDAAARIQSAWREYDKRQNVLSDLDRNQRADEKAIYAQCAERGF